MSRGTGWERGGVEGVRGRAGAKDRAMSVRAHAGNVGIIGSSFFNYFQLFQPTHSINIFFTYEQSVLE